MTFLQLSLCESKYAFLTSSTVDFSGRLIVFPMVLSQCFWNAACILMWASGTISDEAINSR